VSHTRWKSARNGVDAVVEDRLHTGGFYASAANTLTGPLLDQSSIVADFADTATQDNAYDAIHRFLGKGQGSVLPG
jgi:hypothetical protein